MSLYGLMEESNHPYERKNNEHQILIFMLELNENVKAKKEKRKISKNNEDRNFKKALEL